MPPDQRASGSIAVKETERENKDFHQPLCKLLHLIRTITGSSEENSDKRDENFHQQSENKRVWNACPC